MQQRDLSISFGFHKGGHVAELVIARFTEQGIQARDLSENFSGTNEITIKGQQGNAGGNCVALFNGISLSPAQTKGLNCIHLDNNIVTSRMSFDFSISSDIGRFINWINSKSVGIILMVSHTENRTTTELDTFFNTIGSVGWSYYWDVAKWTHRSSYVSILDCRLKKIMTEQFMGHGNTTQQAYISVVFDTYDDIGVTGYGDAIVWDENEYHQSQPGYSVKSYFDKDLSGRELLSTYNIKAGETIEVNAELMTSKQAIIDGCYPALILQFWTLDSKFVSAISVTVAGMPADVWYQRQMSIVVPPTAARIELSLYRYPSKPTSTATVSCRDVVLKLRKPSTTKTMTNGTVGQWGFITSNANESIGNITTNVIGTSRAGEFITQSYDSLDQEWLPVLNGTNYFDIPRWDVSGDFEISQTISYYYPTSDTKTWMRSGQADPTSGETNPLRCGIRTIVHPSGEAHMLQWGSYVSNIPADIEYGRPYTYKIKVINNVPKFYIDGIEVAVGGNGTVKPRSFPNIAIGAEKSGNSVVNYVNGSVHEVSMIDLADDENTRFYNFVLAGQLIDSRKVSAKSSFGGKEYQLIGVTPSPSASVLYAGITSGLCPYGVTAGDKLFVTITSTGASTLVSGLSINTRYECEVIDNPSDKSKKNRVYLKNPISGNNIWIASGNANTLVCNVEYVANPDIHANVYNVDWVDINTNTAVFAGSNFLDIPPITECEFSLKFNTSGSGDGYILEGRTLTETNGDLSSIYISRTTKELVPFGCTISKVNGVDFVSGMAISPNVDYHITGYTSGRVARIGARYNNVEIFSGNIWDISLDGVDDKRYYKNLVKSRYPVISNVIRDEMSTSISVSKKINLYEWVIQPSVSVVDKKSFKVNVATAPTGISNGFGLVNGDKVRIDYDIECGSAIEFRNSRTNDGAAPLIKSLSAGHNRGSVIFTCTSTGGVYIRIANPIINDKIIVSKMNVYKVKTDAVIYDAIKPSYEFELFDEPIIKTSPKLRWCPSAGNELMRLDNPWKPNKDDWKARIKFKVGAITDITNPILGHSVNTSAIMVDQYGTVDTFRVFVFKQSGAVGGIISVKSGLPIGSDANINISVKDGIATVDVNGVKSSGVWDADGTEVISLIGGREARGFMSNIYYVELIDSSLVLGDDRRYDLTLYSSVKPTTSIIQNQLGTIRYLRTANLPSGEFGFVDGDEFTILGRLKDSKYIGGYKVDEFRTTSASGYDVYLRFENNIRPYNSIDIELYSLDENNLESLYGVFNANQSINGAGYGIPDNALLREWFGEVGATRKVVFRPSGQGSALRLINKNWTTV